MRTNTFRSILAVALLGLAMGNGARGDRNDLATALDFAGFELFGTQNPLSGGIDFLAVSDYQNRRFDFGAADFTFDGPISVEVNTGGRILSRFDVSFQTGINSSVDPELLGYEANLIVGGENTKVQGTLLLDGRFGIDALGFYDVQLRTSSRQLTTQGGQPVTGVTRDADVGPVNVSGNIFIDAIAIITDPLFDRAGEDNPFEKVSGISELARILHAPTPNVNELLSGASSALADGISETVGELTGSTDRIASIRNLESLFPGPLPTAPVSFAVPEPTGLILLLVGLPLVLRRGIYGK